MGMHLTRLCAVAGIAALALSSHPAQADTRKWVAVDQLERFTCPSLECGMVGRFFFRESLPVLETKDGWSRVSFYRTAGCFDGKSLYVEAGRAECVEENGIVNGKYSEWVQSQFLAQEPPAKPMNRPQPQAAGGEG